jgi:hypothetical protein
MVMTDEAPSFEVSDDVVAACRFAHNTMRIPVVPIAMHAATAIRTWHGVPPRFPAFIAGRLVTISDLQNDIACALTAMQRRSLHLHLID